MIDVARYELLYTPHVANLKLWKTSGHFDFYKEGMFDQMDVEGDEYQIKPMNCPFHCLVYKDDLRSYRCGVFWTNRPTDRPDGRAIMPPGGAVGRSII